MEYKFVRCSNCGRPLEPIKVRKDGVGVGIAYVYSCCCQQIAEMKEQEQKLKGR